MSTTHTNNSQNKIESNTPPSQFKKLHRCLDNDFDYYHIRSEKSESVSLQKINNENIVAAAEEISGRERLKRHRVEMAGRVWIPDIWGQEDLLKDWIDCTAFDASLVNNTMMSARAALTQERPTPANSTTTHVVRRRIENRC